MKAMEFIGVSVVGIVLVVAGHALGDAMGSRPTGASIGGMLSGYLWAWYGWRNGWWLKKAEKK